MICPRVPAVLRLVTVAALMLAASPGARAEHARIDLRVIAAPGKEASATSDTDPPAGGRITPPIFKVKVNQPLVLQFFFTNTDPHHDIERVQVRYYVVRVEKLGRKPAVSLRDSNGPEKESQP